MWKSSKELLKSIYDAHQRLVTGETDHATAHAEARILGAGVKVLGTSLEHARLTNRLKEWDATLPSMKIGGDDE